MESSQKERKPPECIPRSAFGSRRERQEPKTPVQEASSSSISPLIPLPNQRKLFERSGKFERDIAVLYTTYILQASFDLKYPVSLIREIFQKNENPQFFPILDRCAQLMLYLGVFYECYPSESDEEMGIYQYLTEIVRALNSARDSGTMPDTLISVVNKTIGALSIKFGSRTSGSRTLPVVTNILPPVLSGEGIIALDVIIDAIDLLPVPLIQSAVKTVVDLLQFIPLARSNFSNLRDITVIAGNLVVSLAVVCAEFPSEPPRDFRNAINSFTITLQEIEAQCQEWTQVPPSWDLSKQNIERPDLILNKTRLLTAGHLQKLDSRIVIETNQVGHSSVIGNLPDHPRYTLCEYLPSSRDHILQDISSYIDRSDKPFLLMNGSAGVGKSTVAQQLVKLLRSEGRLAGGVFLGEVTTERPEIIVQMIARQLGEMHSTAVPSISRAIKALTGPHLALEDYLVKYIIDPVREMKYPYNLAVVIDGLDLWAGASEFLRQLNCIPSSSPLKFVLLSRPDRCIEKHFEKVPVLRYTLPVVSQSVISYFFKFHFEKLDWNGRKPDMHIINRLATQASGSLVWAATVRSLLSYESDERYPHVILEKILSGEVKVGCRTGEQLEGLYRCNITSLFPNSEAARMRAYLRIFLGVAVILQEPLNIADFALLSGIPERPTREIHWKLMVFQNHDGVISGHDIVTPASKRFHASFLDFVQSESIWIDTKTIAGTEFDSHAILARGCLDIIFSNLLSSYRGQNCIAPDLRNVESYAVRFWPLHIALGTCRTPMEKGNSSCLLIEFIEGVSEIAMRRWAKLFISSFSIDISSVIDMLDEAKKEELPYQLAMILGKNEAHTIEYEVHCLEVAVRLNQDNARVWKKLGKAYRKLHSSTGKGLCHSIDRSIAAFRRALQLQSIPELSPEDILEELAEALLTRFKNYGTQNDLMESMILLRQILDVNSGCSSTKNLLAISLLNSFDNWGDLRDLEEAISFLEELLDELKNCIPGCILPYNNISCAYLRRFKFFGDKEDLEKAEDFNIDARISLELAPTYQRFEASILVNYSRIVYSRFEQFGILADLELTISTCNEALDRFPEHHADRSLCLLCLGTALRKRFQVQSGSFADLERSISILRDVVSNFPFLHPLRSRAMESLATSLKTRYEAEQENSGDLAESISLYRDILVLQLEPHPHRSITLNNLADALKLRDGSRNVTEAISLLRKALNLRPISHPDRFITLRDLAHVLRIRHEKGLASNDFKEVTLLLKEAVDICPESHVEYPALFEEYQSLL